MKVYVVYIESGDRVYIEVFKKEIDALNRAHYLISERDDVDFVDLKEKELH